MSGTHESADRAHAVASYVESAVAEGKFAPDQRLPAERELAKLLGVSRPSVREGLGLLVARGLLFRRQGAGTYVSDQLERQMAGLWRDMVHQHPAVHADLIEFRETIERRTAELAAVRSTADDRARLKRVAAEVDAAYAGDDRRRQIRSDVAFHRAIADAAHNPVFCYLLSSLLELLHENVQISVAGLTPHSQAACELRRQHRVIVQAVLAGDSSNAGRAAESHLAFVRQRLNGR